jgi:hypothetical protein
VKRTSEDDLTKVTEGIFFFFFACSRASFASSVHTKQKHSHNTSQTNHEARQVKLTTILVAFRFLASSASLRLLHLLSMMWMHSRY